MNRKGSSVVAAAARRCAVAQLESLEPRRLLAALYDPAFGDGGYLFVEGEQPAVDLDKTSGIRSEALLGANIFSPLMDHYFVAGRLSQRLADAATNQTTTELPDYALRILLDAQGQIITGFGDDGIYFDKFVDEHAPVPRTESGFNPFSARPLPDGSLIGHHAGPVLPQNYRVLPGVPDVSRDPSWSGGYEVAAVYPLDDEIALVDAGRTENGQFVELGWGIMNLDDYSVRGPLIPRDPVISDYLVANTILPGKNNDVFLVGGGTLEPNLVPDSISAIRLVFNEDMTQLTPDPNYGTVTLDNGRIGMARFDGGWGRGFAPSFEGAVIDDQGRITWYAGWGPFSTHSGQAPYVGRFTASGTADSSFGGDGIQRVPLANGPSPDLWLATRRGGIYRTGDGKVVGVGYVARTGVGIKSNNVYDTSISDLALAVFRLNPDGSFDSTLDDGEQMWGVGRTVPELNTGRPPRPFTNLSNGNVGNYFPTVTQDRDGSLLVVTNYRYPDFEDDARRVERNGIIAARIIFDDPGGGGGGGGGGGDDDGGSGGSGGGEVPVMDFDAGTGGIHVTGTSSADRVAARLENGMVRIFGGSALSTLLGEQRAGDVRFINLAGGEGADELINELGDAFAGFVTLLGEGGNDTLTGSGRYDRLFGGEGDDSLVGGDRINSSSAAPATTRSSAAVPATPSGARRATTC